MRIIAPAFLTAGLLAAAPVASAVVVFDFESDPLGSTNGGSTVVDDGTGNRLLEADLASGGFLGQKGFGRSTLSSAGVDADDVVAITADVTFEASPSNTTPVGLNFTFQNFVGGSENRTELGGVPVSEGSQNIRFDFTPSTRAGFLAGFDPANGGNNFQNIQFITDPSFGLAGTLTIDNVAFVVPEPASLALLGLGGMVLLGRRRG